VFDSIGSSIVQDGGILDQTLTYQVTTSPNSLGSGEHRYKTKIYCALIQWKNSFLIAGFFDL